MRLERAVRFGFVGSIGVIAISLGTFGVLRIARDPSRPAGKAFIFLLVVGLGTAVTLMFLFALIDVFIDEKLELRERSGPEE